MKFFIYSLRFICQNFFNNNNNNKICVPCDGENHQGGVMGYQIRAFCVVIKNKNMVLFIHFDMHICFIRLIFLQK